VTRFSFTLSFALTLAVALLVATPVHAQADADKAEEAITENVLRSAVRFLSSDLIEGRGPASKGDDLTLLYLATEMEKLGLEPGGHEGEWMQKVDMVGVSSTAPDTWTFDAKGTSVSLKFWDEYIAASGNHEETSSIENAELVFVGYGIQAPEYKWDDYKGVDVKGKILVMMNNDPDWDPELFGGPARLYYGRWTYKYEMAAALGAEAAFIIHTDASAGYPFQVVQSSWTGEQFTLPPRGEPTIKAQSWATYDAAKRLLAAAGHDLDKLMESAKSRRFKPVSLGIRSSLTLQNQVSRRQTANVAGLLRGSDPPLRNEVVVYTAHHDHLGIGKANEHGDTIYNGARDNASGCAQVLAIARAFTALPVAPKRSILFLFVAAEEQGLLGSKFYAMNPTFPPGRIAANINYDAANIWGRTRDLTLIGYGRSSLDDVARKYAEAQGRTLEGDPTPEQGSYYRSDQFNFAKIGVPALYMKGGTNFVDKPAGQGKELIQNYTRRHYHQPSDELSNEWDFSGIVEDSVLGFRAGLEIANTETMPSWKPGDEFEAARKKALAEAGK
jgi:Zn-dependent M28 family amino/carboxypeptidase